MSWLRRASDEEKQPAVAIELYFDAATERAVLDLRNLLYDAGIRPDPGLIEARPHLTMTILEGDRIPVDLVRSFAAAARPRTVRLASLATFPGEQGVLFLAPTPDDGLLGLHRDLHDRLRGSASASRQAYEPEAWIPHCTLEKDIAPADIPRAFDVLRRAFRPIEGELVEVAAIRFPPLEVVELAGLGQEP